MHKKKYHHVAVCMGGPSSEREISLQSGTAVSNALRSCGYTVTDVVIGRDRAFDWPADADAAFIAMHGHFGEDGGIQQLLEERGIPHTGSSAKASAAAFDKQRSKQLLAKAGIPTPAFEFISSGGSRTLPLPVVIKPVRQGSSVGMSRIFREDDWPAALDLALGYDDTALVEEFIPGKELTVGIVGRHILPVVEIITPDGNFDYQAKYTPGAASHLVPAPLDPAILKACQHAASHCAEVLQCTGMGRVDIRLRPDGRLFVLELNNIPGLTEISLLPDAAREYGWSFPELCERILNEARIF